jgi:UPF0755 protein
MDNMIRRPTPPTQPPVQQTQVQPTPPSQTWPQPAPAIQRVQPIQPQQKPKRRRRRWPWVLLAIFLLIAGALTAGFLWYQSQLSPVDANDTSRKVVKVLEGDTPSSIASQLKNEGLIRDIRVFSIYTRFSGSQVSLQAGTYRLSPSESLPQIVDHLNKGNVDAFSIRFLPGGTLADHKKVLLNAGYGEADIDTAFTATYTGSLFEGRPAGSDIEGYIYGETYSVTSGATVKDILEITFKQFEQVIAQNDLKTKFQEQGLSLYEGITLASIIQREASGNNDEATIAQVFYNRYRQGIVLGSDVTYQYAADKEGRERSTTLDSPYNTRIKQGLPPTPISSPGLKALQAVANPTTGDFMYFLSGDDDVTYYGRTIQEHEANIQQHCQKKCQII